MDDTVSLDLSLPDNILQPFLVFSGSSTLKQALECLIEIAKTTDGRWDLASKRLVVPVLQLCQFLSCPSHRNLLLSTLKLLRNLCAGEIKNQNLFIEQNGVGVLSRIVSSVGLASSSDNGILRMLLQVLGNVSLAGEEHQLVVWRQFFSSGFLEIARVRSKETCDPLCMIIYTCSGGSDGLHGDLCSDSGLEIVIEILRTATLAGFTEDWPKLLLSRIFLEESCFSSTFSRLFPVFATEKCDGTVSAVNNFGPEQAFLLSILSKTLNEGVGDVVSNDFALFVFEILKTAVGIVDFTTRGTSNLPTGSSDIDVMGYSMAILRDICACDGPKDFNQNEKESAKEILVSSGLIELLITLLRSLEPPAIIRKAMNQSEAKDGITSQSFKYCVYKGLRRDIVGIIGNCCYHRKLVQDKVRELDGIVLLLQQCVIDEENPFLREWGMWSVHNLLEGNEENLKLVASLELQGTVDVPELAQMGLRVDVDPKTHRAKLVNV
ncbi:hypothetical protein ACJIZ3_016150 [Penstemon smallii]|uniref:Ataxin-10 domain-containing protein n=1 Tax=Penstemon smallii TaxID=265156 RepID=A0ABD3RRX0_9LAMI